MQPLLRAINQWENQNAQRLMDVKGHVEDFTGILFHRAGEALGFAAYVVYSMAKTLLVILERVFFERPKLYRQVEPGRFEEL